MSAERAAAPCPWEYRQCQGRTARCDCGGDGRRCPLPTAPGRVARVPGAPDGGYGGRAGPVGGDVRAGGGLPSPVPRQDRRGGRGLAVRDRQAPARALLPPRPRRAARAEQARAGTPAGVRRAAAGGGGTRGARTTCAATSPRPSTRSRSRSATPSSCASSTNCPTRTSRAPCTSPNRRPAPASHAAWPPSPTCSTRPPSGRRPPHEPRRLHGRLRPRPQARGRHATARSAASRASLLPGGRRRWPSRSP